jgi:hypothetical protein
LRASWNGTQFVGRSADSLSLFERTGLVGQWIALERYTPETLPLRTIEAIGESPAACARQLEGRGLKAANYEFVQVTPSW